MICPNCKSEFIEGIISCPDCVVSLVHYQTNETSDNSEPLEQYNYVFVYNPISSQEVALIKMIMEREAIPYIFKNDPIHKVSIFSIQDSGSIELYVAEQFAEDTIKLLKNELGHD